MRPNRTFLTFGILFLSSGYAAAQTLPPPQTTQPEQQSVFMRTLPQFAPRGQPIGAFILYPGIDIGGAYNSNVYATQSNTKGDFVASLDPSLSLRSNWIRNALNFNVSGAFRRYAQQTANNENNFSADVDGRLDIRTDTYMTGGIGYRLAHEPRTSPNTVLNQKYPTEYQLTTGKLGFVRERGIIGFELHSQVSYYSYNNNVTGNGTPIAESDRNRIEYSVTPRITYQIVKGYRAFIQASGNERSYQSKFDQFGYQRDSHGYQVDAGTAVQLTNLITGEIFAGYLQQDYKDSRLPTASGPGFGGNLLWNVTPLTSVRATLSRTVQEWNSFESSQPPVSSYIATTTGVSVEHQVHDDLLASAGIDYENDDFQGISRSDNVYGGSAGIRYLINRHLSAGVNFAYNRRESNVAFISYDQEIIGASIRLQY